MFSTRGVIMVRDTMMVRTSADRQPGVLQQAWAQLSQFVVLRMAMLDPGDRPRATGPTPTHVLVVDVCLCIHGIGQCTTLAQ